MGQTIFMVIIVIWIFLILYKAIKAGRLDFQKDIEDDILHSITEKKDYPLKNNSKISK